MASVVGCVVLVGCCFPLDKSVTYLLFLFCRPLTKEDKLNSRIQDLKEKNASLSKVNSELQEELKTVRCTATATTTRFFCFLFLFVCLCVFLLMTVTCLEAACL